MNTNKMDYTKPLIEIVDVETEGVIADSVGVNTQDKYSGTAGARERSFWEE